MGKGQTRHANLPDQNKPPRDVQGRLAGTYRRAQTAGLARQKPDDKQRKEPKAQHHHHLHGVLHGQVARHPVLCGKDQRGQHHHPDAAPRVLLGHVGVALRAWVSA